MRQCAHEHLSREQTATFVLRDLRGHAQSPNCAPDTVIRRRSDVESTLIAPVVAETSTRLLRAVQVAQVRRYERTRVRGALHAIGVQRDYESARIVVYAVTRAP